MTYEELEIEVSGIHLDHSGYAAKLMHNELDALKLHMEKHRLLIEQHDLKLEINKVRMNHIDSVIYRCLIPVTIVLGLSVVIHWFVS